MKSLVNKLLLLALMSLLALGSAYLYRQYIPGARMMKIKINADKGSILVFDSTDPTGMFATFSVILGLLDFYEKNPETYNGIKINLDGGLYFDANYGPNWWNYFFSPIDFTKNRGPTYKMSLDEQLKLAHNGFHMPRHRAYELIQKYVHVKPQIQKEVDLFSEMNFKEHFVIGVHHRGTDKIQEMPLVTYEQSLKAINNVIDSLKPEQKQKIKIYVATDDQHFLDYLVAVFPKEVVYNNFVRAVDDKALHIIKNDPRFNSNYDKGKEALIDCLLLSKCQHLIRPWSSLSIVADHFSPDMPITTIWGKK